MSPSLPIGGNLSLRAVVLTARTTGDRIESMAGTLNPPERLDTPVFTGLTAFFDVLGYKMMLANNEPEEVNKIIRDILHRVPGDVNFERIELSLYGLNPEYLIFSDSVLVYQTMQSPGPSETFLHRFINYCSQLTGELLSGGLPVRGAIAKGKFSIVAGKSFAGKCIVEAYELAQSLEMAGCAIVPGLESEVLADRNNRKGLLLWPTPVKKSSPQEILMLDYSRFFERSKSISRGALIECFAAYRKNISVEVYPKINNTLRFLKLCKSRRTRGRK